MRIGIRVNQLQALELLGEALPSYRTDLHPGSEVDYLFGAILGGPGPKKGTLDLSLLYVAAVRLARSREFNDVVVTLRDELDRLISQWSPHWTFVQAGVVGWKNAAVVITGLDSASKVQELVANGATYFSEQYAVLDSEGLVHPYPRLAQGKLAAQSTPLPIGHLYIGQGDGEGPDIITELPASIGLLHLVGNAINSKRKPQELLRSVRDLSFKTLQGPSNKIAQAVLS